MTAVVPVAVRSGSGSISLGTAAAAEAVAQLLPTRLTLARDAAARNLAYGQYFGCICESARNLAYSQ